MDKIIRKGIVSAKMGNELWVNTLTDEAVKIQFKDVIAHWDMYGKPVRVTIEIIDESELKND